MVIMANMTSFISVVKSPLQLWKTKQTTPLQRSPTVQPGRLSNEEEEEEDGFTFVGESAIERNTVYPSQISQEPLYVQPPPSYRHYQAFSLPYSAPYLHPDHDVNVTSPLNPLASQQAWEMPSDYRPTQGLNITSSTHPFITDVPFALSPHLGDGPADYNLGGRLPDVSPSMYTYDFSFEKHIAAVDASVVFNQESDASVEREPTREDDDARDATRNPRDQSEADDDDDGAAGGDDYEDSIVQQFGKEVVVVQNMQDLFGGAQCDTEGTSSLEEQQDLMSF